MRYALIGVTGIGGYHLDVLRQMSADGDLKLVAAVDPALAQLPKLRAELSAMGARSYAGFEEMLRSEADLDVVVISAPIPFHLQMTLACLERDIFVYLEKPPVPLIQQLRTMLAADKRRRVGVGFQMISASWVQEIKRAIMQGELGRLQHIRIGACWPRLDHYYGRNASAGKMVINGEPVFDGPATNALAHLIHNGMFLAGATAEEFDVPTEVQAELYRARPIESYDVACLRGTFRSGAAFSAALTHATEKALLYQIEVIGTKGWARVSNDGRTLEGSIPLADCPNESFEELLAKTHRRFYEFAKGKCERPTTSLADTLGYVLATNGMMLSSEEIFSIEKAYLERYVNEAETGYDVRGLYGAVEQSVRTGRLFSELGLPWAVKTEAVSVKNLQSLTLPGAVPQYV